MKKVVLFGLIIVFFIVLVVVVSFYSLPYTKGSECIQYVNKNVVSTEENAWISADDLEFLRIVDEEYISETVMIEVRTKPTFSLVSWNKLCISYDITATVKDWEDWEEIESFSGQRKVIFAFSSFEWIVEEVICE